MYNFKKETKMTEQEIEKEIQRKEQEIRDLMRFENFIGKENLQKQIDLRLDDLSKLYKRRKKD